MRKILSTLFLSILSMSSFAASTDDPVQMDGLSIFKLNDFQQKSIAFQVQMPGKYSGVCHLIIRSNGSDKAFTKFAKQFIITETYTGNDESRKVTPVSSSYGLSMKLSLHEGPYISDTIKIETYDGRSIADNIKDSFPNLGASSIAVLTGMCNLPHA